MARQIKELMVGELTKEIEKSSALLLAGFVDIPAADMNDLRTKLKEYSTRHIVVKNSTCRLALQHCHFEKAAGLLSGPTSITIVHGSDVTGVAKLLVNFAKEHKGLELRGGYVDGEMVTLDQVRELSAIPPREVLLGQMVSNMKAPLARLVFVLSGTLTKLNLVLEAIKEKKSELGGGKDG
ncbi:MAG: 50S ribosomal protein L10 [Candidatus Omnitrophica bacterium]|nr:50S ribosomal protein L10 [Candidatus Omnitrophota bacterium]